MIVDIGQILVNRINTLPFIDKIAGVVKILSYSNVDKDNKPIKQTFPVACNSEIDFNSCDSSRYSDLCPDDTKLSVIYFEDKGIRVIEIDGTKIKYSASLDLICWLNLALMGVTDCSFSGIALSNIIKNLIGNGVPFQSGIYQQVKINPVFEKPKSENPFVKYTYNMESQQLLMYPYDHFVLSLEVSFIVDSRCIQNIVLNQPNECLKS